MCVARAALGAARDGYRVYAVLDASGHFSPRAAAAAVLRMRAGGVAVANCAAVLIELVDGELVGAASELLAASLRHMLPRPPVVTRAVGGQRRGRSDPSVADAQLPRQRNVGAAFRSSDASAHPR